MGRPSFYKFLTDGFTSHSQVPEDFMKHFCGVVPQKCTIWSVCGRSWDVEMVSINVNNLFFGKGWEILVSDHSLEEGDLLIFKYRGTSAFDVKVYGKNRCEKVPNKLDADIGNGIGTQKAKSNPHFTPSVQRDFDDDSANGVGSEKEKSNPIMKSLVYVIEDSDDECYTTYTRVAPKKKAKYSAPDEDASNIMPKSEKLDLDSASTEDVAFTGKTIYSSSPFTSGLSCKSNKGKMKDEIPIAATPINFVVGTPKNPNFEVVMKPCNLLGANGAYVTVPHKFYIHYLNGKDKDFTVFLIVDKSSKSWPIKYRASTHRLGCGWLDFAKDNHLVVNDLCVFEMVEVVEDMPRTMKVEIQRRK